MRAYVLTAPTHRKPAPAGAFPGISGDPAGVTFGPTAFTNPAGCQDVLSAWAPGIPDNLGLPGFVGLPLGPSSPYKSYILQMHYSNVDRVSGIVDRSELTMYYTPTLAGRTMARLLGPGLARKPEPSPFLPRIFLSRSCFRAVVAAAAPQL